MAKHISNVRLNSANVRKIMKSDKVRKDLYRRGKQIAAAAGPGMEATFPMNTKLRARVAVVTTTDAARKAEARNRALTRAIDAGRF